MSGRARTWPGGMTTLSVTVRRTRIVKRTKKEKRDNPYLSDADYEERLAFEKRNRTIKLIIVGSVVFVPLILWLLYRYGTTP